ncbi:hypothetical protein J7T55_012380 [Diaporthe amygdali]|uniref:uncharacterized protein n=1 Tax=Phomopsis amygdali TaxID=1214568 RepID=UPI0022FE1BF1|nr:uncharacterized protein J7T55_012380 [Diaporthe amygdali]KAJ0123908.1 hypothetical protein J7T55_012380 [Diaporthe amygdali]
MFDLFKHQGYDCDGQKMELGKIAPEGRTDVAEGSILEIEPSVAMTSEHNLHVVQQAIETIGMGKYQWLLAFSCGFGFLVDQMLLVSVSLVTPQASMEFDPQYPTLLSAALYAGLVIGALSVGQLADIVGRFLVWQLSIFGVAIFSMIAASAPNWTALNVFVALTGIFGGGNLAIDLTLLTECLPVRFSFILTGLASVWGLGSAITGAIAWPLLVNYGCPNGETMTMCSKNSNMGWRYLYITLGGLGLVMSIVRSFVLHSQESPKWLVANGQVDEAVYVLNNIGKSNKSEHRVTRQDFITNTVSDTKSSRHRNFRRIIQSVVTLFTGSGQLRLMSCLIMTWALIGICYPLFIIFLPYYLEAHGARLGTSSSYQTYRDWTVSSVAGILGPFLGMAMIAAPWLKSRRSIATAAFACAAFSGAFTSVKTEAQNLAFSCMINFWLNALYGIVYA